MNVTNYCTSKVLTVTPRDSIDRAITLMEDHSVHHLVVTVDGRLAGMLSDRDILISTGWMLEVERRTDADRKSSVVGPTRVGQIMSRSLAGLDNTAGAAEAATLMVELKVGALPIMREQHVVGVLSESDLVGWMCALAIPGNKVDQFLQREVRALMRSPVISLTPDALLSDAVSLFRQYRIRHIPVLVNKSLMGIISDRDVRRLLGWSSVQDMKAQAEGRLPAEETPDTVSGIMQKEVVTIDEHATIRDAARRMADHRIHALPVLSGKAVVGIITQSDLIRAIAIEDLL